MNQESKRTAGFGAVILFFLVLGLSSDSIDFSTVKLLAGVLGLILVVAFVVKNKKAGEYLKQFQKNKSSTGENYNLDECEEIAKEFGKKRFTGINSKKGVQFDWARSKTQPVPIVSDVNSMDWIVVRHFYATKGENSQPMNIFVDASNGSVFGVDQVDTRSKKTDPFKSLKAWQITKRVLSRKTFTDDERNGQGVMPQGVPQGIPAYNMPGFQQGGRGGEGEE